MDACSAWFSTLEIDAYWWWTSDGQWRSGLCCSRGLRSSCETFFPPWNLVTIKLQRNRCELQLTTVRPQHSNYKLLKTFFSPAIGFLNPQRSFPLICRDVLISSSVLMFLLPFLSKTHKHKPNLRPEIWDKQNLQRPEKPHHCSDVNMQHNLETFGREISRNANRNTVTAGRGNSGCCSGQMVFSQDFCFHSRLFSLRGAVILFHTQLWVNADRRSAVL